MLLEGRSSARKETLKLNRLAKVHRSVQPKTPLFVVDGTINRIRLSGKRRRTLTGKQCWLQQDMYLRFTSLLETFLIDTVEEHLTVKGLYIHTAGLRRKIYPPAGGFQLMEQVLLFLLAQPLAKWKSGGDSFHFCLTGYRSIR